MTSDTPSVALHDQRELSTFEKSVKSHVIGIRYHEQHRYLILPTDTTRDMLLNDVKKLLQMKSTSDLRELFEFIAEDFSSDLSWNDFLPRVLVSSQETEIICVPEIGHFVYNGYLCEKAYILDLDQELFEFYEGKVGHEAVGYFSGRQPIGDTYAVSFIESITFAKLRSF